MLFEALVGLFEFVNVVLLFLDRLCELFYFVLQGLHFGPELIGDLVPLLCVGVGLADVVLLFGFKFDYELTELCFVLIVLLLVVMVLDL